MLGQDWGLGKRRGWWRVELQNPDFFDIAVAKYAFVADFEINVAT